MGKSIVEIQSEIFNEINDPSTRIQLKVQEKKIDRNAFLADIKQRVLNEGISEEDADDVAYLVDKALWGWGPIDDLIEDDDISDIRIIDEDNIRIKKLGKRMGTNIHFSSREEYNRFISFVAGRNKTNESIQNAAQVFTDKDTNEKYILRFSLSSELINTNGHSTLLIRKIPKQKRDFAWLTDKRNFSSPDRVFLTTAQADYIKKRWKNGHGFLVCGPNGSGKTTLINAILEETPFSKSAVIIQESEELFCEKHPEMLFRKVIPNRSGSIISYSLRDLARLALMESFDIIVVGEIKGDEAAEMSYASYTGSQTMTSIHSNSAEEGYDKLIDYALDAQPNRNREHFAKQLKTLDTVVFVKDYKVQNILEMHGYDKKTGEYDLRPAEITGESEK